MQYFSNDPVLYVNNIPQENVQACMHVCYYIMYIYMIQLILGNICILCMSEGLLLTIPGIVCNNFTCTYRPQDRQPLTKLPVVPETLREQAELAIQRIQPDATDGDLLQAFMRLCVHVCCKALEFKNNSKNSIASGPNVRHRRQFSKLQCMRMKTSESANQKRGARKQRR